MKRYFLKLTVLVLILAGSLPTRAQDFDIKVKADTILTPGSKCNVEISIIGGAGLFTYMLYDNEPWDGGKLLEKTSPTNELTHSFTISTAGRYLVAVRDHNELTKIIIIQIKLAATASLIQMSATSGKEYLM
jgi:hypothetical protein